MNSSRISETIIEYTFYLLFLLVPIIWLPVTSELFEFNKMVLVYLGAAIVLTAWFFKSVNDRVFILKRTPLDIPILLFLAANIASTVFSIDRHVSIFGYYDRFNGGLLSTIAYIILYYGLVTFFDKEKLFNLLKILLFSACLVSVYAILQHPTPLFRNADGSFRGIDAGYWQQNSQARVFSTLGHPNWLAAFLLIVTPIAFFFLTVSRGVREKILLTLALVLYFLAFTFTYSRGGTIGFAAMVFTLAAGLVFAFRRQVFQLLKLKKFRLGQIKPPKIGFFLGIVLVSWVATVAFFGNAFTSRGVDFAAITAAGDTQLASAGSETGKIRLIVWKGAVDIFRHYPIFGSGVETFAFGYYEFRPPEHNLTSEWDFLYNKAHNEFVNYLATTGAIGIATYLILIITFVALVIAYLRRKTDSREKIFAVTLLAGYVGYHGQNIFGFSVVTIALLFYLTPAFLFIVANNLTTVKLSIQLLSKPLFYSLARAAAVLLGIFMVYVIFAMWLADFYYNQGISTTNKISSYQTLKSAVSLRPDEPLYQANLGLATMQLALDKSGPEQKEKIGESFSYLNRATTSSPNNINIWRYRLQAIFNLASSQDEYKPQVARTAKIIGDLAPTEAQIQYDLGSMYVFGGDYKQAQKQLEKVVRLKFNYKDAWLLLLKVDSRLKNTQSLRKHYQKFKEIFPDEAKDQKFLKEIGII